MHRHFFPPLFSTVLICTLLLLSGVANALYAAPKPTLRDTGSGWKACDPDVPQWSGYFDIPGKDGDKHYFYWAFGPRSKNPNASVLLWMTGGPGCSSTLALLAENGPCLMDEKTGEIYNNTYGWNTDAYLIYIDQPAGVGFSYANQSDYDTNEKEVAEDMYNFLQAFFTKYKDLQNNDFFVVGESYGGHYAPATAYRINEGNKKREGMPIHLAGLAVGNGLTDPYTQYAAYPFVAWDWCKEKLGKPCVSESSYSLMRAAVPVCQKFIEVCNAGDSAVEQGACIAGRFTCNPIVALYSSTGLNNYDIRKQCEGQLCYDFRAIDSFMNRKDVQESLGVDAQKWESCNMNVNLMFGVDWFKNFNYTVPALLNDGVRVMIYAGDMDFICNWVGNKQWTLALQWSGAEAFNKANDTTFYRSDGTAAGLVRRVATAAAPLHFSFVQVYDAGHMVPMDQPDASLVMINKFMQNKELD